jgi:myo-inositol-1(or 4)-monophosphatase
VDADTATAICRDISELVRAAALELRPTDRMVHQELSRDLKIAGDRRTHEWISRRLESYGWPILSEEAPVPLPDVGPCWIIDPIDGSVNFARQIPFCCVSAALWDDARPVLGAVADVTRNETFTGVVGQCAWLGTEVLRCSSIRRLSQAVLCTGFPAALDFSTDAIRSFVTDIQRFQKIRLLGSAALSLAYVAAGRADAYIERSIAIWDIAAGAALVSAAGGIVQFTPTTQAFRYHVEAFANDSIAAEWSGREMNPK